MGSSDEPPPYTEPVIAQDAFATGIDIESLDGQIRLVAWVDMPEERRIVSRLVIPADTARTLIADLRKVLQKGGH